MKGETRTIGRPYYDFFLRTFGLPLLLLMGIGPLDRLAQDERARAWCGRSPGRSPRRSSTGVVLVAVGAGSSAPGLIAYTFSAFVLATIVVELVRGTRATGSLFTLVSRNRRRYGGYVVHAAIVLLAIGIAGSSAYSSSVERRLALGQSMTIAGYTLTNRGVTVDAKPNVHGDACAPRRDRAVERLDQLGRQPLREPARAVA